jgi:hypothetical protein
VKPPFADPDPETPEVLQDETEDPDVPRPMFPRERQRLRAGHPPQAIPIRSERLGSEWEDEAGERTARPTRQDLDPVFGYIMALALSVGLTPLQANVRYVALWAFLAAMGGMAFVLGSGIRFKVTDPGDLLVGIGLGVFTGGALLLVGGDTLATVSERLFSGGDEDNVLLDTWIFQALVFVMPVAETLFFRGAMQRIHSMPSVAVLASIWSMLMFFPNLGLAETPVVGVVFGTAIVLLNFLYGYVHWRNGLAASFFCQITAGTLLLLVPRLVTI